MNRYPARACKRWPLLGSALLALAAVSLASPVALAEEEAEGSDDGGSDSVDVGVGLIGVLGGNFLDKPENPGSYPGFGGMMLGGGLLVDLRFINLIGVELDVIRSSDKGNGSINDVDITIGQSAWHLPVLAKVTLPTPLIALSLFMGPEFVFPGDGSAETDPEIPPGFPQPSAKADNYTMFTAGVGLEIKLPLPALDLRVPVTLRGSYNPGVSNDLQDRISPSGTFNSEWKYAFGLTVGAGIYF